MQILRQMLPCVGWPFYYQEKKTIEQTNRIHKLTANVCPHTFLKYSMCPLICEICLLLFEATKNLDV